MVNSNIKNQSVHQKIESQQEQISELNMRVNSIQSNINIMYKLIFEQNK